MHYAKRMLASRNLLMEEAECSFKLWVYWLGYPGSCSGIIELARISRWRPRRRRHAEWQKPDWSCKVRCHKAGSSGCGKLQRGFSPQRTPGFTERPWTSMHGNPRIFTDSSRWFVG